MSRDAPMVGDLVFDEEAEADANDPGMICPLCFAVRHYS